MPNSEKDLEYENLASYKRILLTRQGLRTERCHAIRHHGSYTVGHHTAAMLALLWEVYPDDFGTIGPYILGHDVPEAWLGDVPAPPKRYSREINRIFGEMEDKINRELALPLESTLKETMPDQYKKLKDLDWLELYLWCRDEVTMGNKNCLRVIEELNKFRKEQPLAEEIGAIADYFKGDILMSVPDCIEEMWGT